MINIYSRIYDDAIFISFSAGRLPRSIDLAMCRNQVRLTNDAYAALSDVVYGMYAVWRTVPFRIKEILADDRHEA